MVDVAKREDQLLDKISSLLVTIAALELELAQYRTIVPATTVNPAHV